jgi:hypothetical protein
MKRRIRLPEPVAAIYRAVKDLEALYPRKFTPDGHLVGSIGEVVAADALGLTLYPMSRAGHDAYDANGDVQIKMTAGRSVAMYAESIRLVVLRVLCKRCGDSRPGFGGRYCVGRAYRGRRWRRLIRCF